MNASGAQRRIPELDGLRGTAILLVVVFHYILQQGIPTDSLTAHLQRIVLMGGGAGVDLFFVLSGFLIGGILLDARTSPSYFRTFYTRRVFRIIPLYYAWITLYIAMVIFAGPIVERHTHFGEKLTLNFEIYSHYLFIQNLGFVNLTGLAQAWFSPTWSLAVEEQFYLVSPLVIRLLSKRNLYKFLASIIVIAPVIRMGLLKIAHVDQGTIYSFTLCRADTLAVGILVALLWREPKFRDWLSAHEPLFYGLFGILLAGFVGFWKWSPEYSSFPMEAGGYTWAAFFFATLLLLALQDTGGPIASMMRMGWLRELGTVSYCVYIIHLVVNVICHTILLHATPQISTPKGAAVTILAAALTYALAKVSWICFEGPILRLGHSFKYAETGKETFSDRPPVEVGSA